MTHISSVSEFNEKVLQAKESVLVDFFAMWCGPCQMISSMIEELAREVGEDRVFKIDVDQVSELAEKYGVMSIPNIKIFKNGEIKEDLVGIQEKRKLMELLQKHN